jgi:hypothetical protein
VAALISLAAYSPGQVPGPTLTPAPSPTALPTISLDETCAKEFAITDFDAVHAPTNGDPNKYLIFGNLAVSKPTAELAPKLAAFLGRWEGY